MGTADEISLIYAVNRAYFPTLTAGNTLVVINGGEVICHLDCLGGTRLLTLAAGYTAALTELADLNALVMIITLNYYAGDILYEMDYTVGAGSRAKAAADTFLGVYLGYAALGDADSVSRANLGAVTVAKAGEGAKSVARKIHICRLAGLGTAIDILSLLGLAGAVAGNVSDLLDDVVSLNAENGGDSLGGTVTAGGTEIGLIGYALGKSLCIALAARKAAGAAVSTRKALAYLICPLVLLDTEIS